MAAPFLRSIAERTARAQGSSPPATPRRLIAMFTHYGCVTTHWFPDNSHGPLSSEDLLSTNLAALEPHRSNLLIPRGIRAMNQWTASLEFGQGNDPHTQVVGSYLTCHPVTPNTDDPFDINNTAAKFSAQPIARSLDHVCAEQLNPGGLPLLLRVSGASDNAQSAISYIAPEERFPGIGNPEEALGALTGLFQGGELTPDSYQAVRGKSIFDLVRDDLETLERFDMSQADRDKLEAWKDLLNDTTGIVVSSYCSEQTQQDLGLTAETVAAFQELAGDRLTTKLAGDLDGADLFTNIAVLAALCDTSRVTILKYPGNYVFTGLDLTTESHTLSHRLTQENCPQSAIENLEVIDRYHVSKFAHLVAMLDAFDEGDGTLLDNSAAVWFQEMSDGAAHNLNNMPLIQAGSCGGYFKTGQVVNVDDGSSDLHRGYSHYGCDTPLPEGVVTTGTPPEFANAPINKYYCNLMNAIGVKAGPDGFPLAGGTEEVTHYGMYDRTEDFIGGGVQPAHIEYPGAFEDLEA